MGAEGSGSRRRRARRLLAAQGQLRQRHGLMGEALRGQHGEGVTWRAKADAQNKPRHPRSGAAPKTSRHSLSMYPWRATMRARSGLPKGE